jgi:AcrR family transcriptional regulator
VQNERRGDDRASSGAAGTIVQPCTKYKLLVHLKYTHDAAMSITSDPREAPEWLAGARSLSPRQEEVLDVVEAVFLRDGMKAVRIGELAAEASCSRSTLYDLAPSKEDLFLLVLDRMLRRIMQRGTEAIERAADPVDRVRAMMTSGALDLGALGPRFLDAVRRHPPARLLFDRRLADGRDTLERLIEEGVEAGLLRHVNVPVVAEAIITVLLRFTDPEFVASRRADAASDLAELVEIFLDGLRPRPSAV